MNIVHQLPVCERCNKVKIVTVIVDNEPGRYRETEVECQNCLEELLTKYSKQYHALLAQGVDELMAERIVRRQIAQDGIQNNC